MTHDPNHPIWADIEGSAHRMREKVQEIYNSSEEPHIDPTHQRLHRLESWFDRTLGGQTSAAPLEARWGSTMSGHDEGGKNSVRSPEVEEYYLGHGDYARSPERTANVAKRADDVQNVLDRRAEKHGEDYETHVFPYGTYPEQESNTHTAVTYHKPTGEPVSSMSFTSSGYVGSWAALEDHRGNAALSTGLAAHRYLKSIGHPTGILRANSTTDDSARVIKALDPDSTSLTERWALAKYDAEDTERMHNNTIRESGVPENLRDVHSTPTTEDYARLSDMTGRHPMNFMAISPRVRDRQIAAMEGYTTGEHSRLDPTMLVRANELDEAGKASYAHIHYDEVNRSMQQNRRRARSERNVSRFMRSMSDNPSDPQWDELAHHELDGFATTRTNREQGIRAEAIGQEVEDYPERLHDAGMYVHKEEYKPRTTEERLAQDPLARARIIRGKAFYDG